VLNHVAAPRNTPPSSTDVYLEHRAVIERAIAFICRRQRLTSADADDFASDAHFHLIKDDGAVLRAHAGRSSLQTYIVAVLSHLFQDWRNARWGKWRPSAEARRLGPLAVRLETLVGRDGYSFAEAVETLRTNFQVQVTDSEIEALRCRLPVRVRRSFASVETIGEIATTVRPPDAALAAAAAVTSARRAHRALHDALAALESQDRLILRLRFEDGLRINEIATLLHEDASRLYRRVQRLLDRLRRVLEAAGLSRHDVLDAMEEHGFDAADLDQRSAQTQNEVRQLKRRDRTRPTTGEWQ
jgi:RNA polymerase sigma factor (sigma-70 family)